MKKHLSHLLCLGLALCLVFSFSGCSDTEMKDQGDYNYIITLLERGEYDLAIQVIEMLRDSGSVESDPVAPTPQDSSSVPSSTESSETLPDTTSVPAPVSRTVPMDDPATEGIPCGITVPTEISFHIAPTLNGENNYRFSFTMVNQTGHTLTLASYTVAEYAGGVITDTYSPDATDFTGEDWYTLAPDASCTVDDYCTVHDLDFDMRTYRFVYEDEEHITYPLVFYFNMNSIMDTDTLSLLERPDYATDSGKDLSTLRYDSLFEIEIATDIYWVPARALGKSKFTNAEMFNLTVRSPEEKQAAISSLCEALQLYEIGGFTTLDDCIQTDKNGIIWEHHKPGYDAVLTNQGCCAAAANWLNYLLDGDYEETGYIATIYRDGRSHIINYILQDNWYYMIDLTNYLAGAGQRSTDLEDSYSTNFILGNILKTSSPDLYADYIRRTFSDPPALIVKYTAENIPAVNSSKSSGTTEIVYARMNHVKVQVIYDDPNDNITFRMKPPPIQLPVWN